MPITSPLSSRWDAIPFSPRIVPFFYGWIIALVAVLGLLMSVPGQTMGVSVFTDPLLNALKLSRMQLSASYMIGTFVSALLLPKAGKLYDHLGARIMTPCAAIGLSLTLLLVSEISSIVDLLKIYFPSAGAWIAMIAMCICFSFLRFFGQGMLTMLPRNMAMKWFVRRRGLINGFFGLSVAFGFSTLTYALNEMVQALGFESALYYVALFIGLGFSTIAALLFRDTPQGSGLLPDGGLNGTTTKEMGSGVLLDDANLAQVRKYFEFWIYCIAPAFVALSITAVSFHIVSIFDSAGYSRDVAVGVYIPAAIISASLVLLLGWLSDRTRLCLLLRLSCFAQLIFYIGLLNLETPAGYWMFALGLGLSQSTFGLLLGLSWPRLFGVIHLGEISGFAMSIMVCGSAIGPLLFGLSFHFSDSYSSAEFFCLIVAFVLFFGSFRAKS